MSMLRGLKIRLALSHTLPVLVFVPLLGVALLYQLERYYFLDNLAVELVAQGTIIAQFTRDEQNLWQDPLLAQLVVQQLTEQLSAHVMLIDISERVVAATWYDNTAHTGQIVNSSIVEQALNGRPAWMVSYSASLRQQVIDVAVPVVVPPGRVIGAVRLSATLDEIQERLRPLRWLVLATLFAGATLSLILGLILAGSLGAPLIRLTNAVARFSPLTPPETVPETGPDEVKTLAQSFNRLGHRLYELERTRNALLSGIVHEIGRPLGAIKAAAQTIPATKDGALCAELALGISEQVDQLRAQLDDLALLAEMELQGLTISPEAVDIGELLYAQCHQVAGLVRARNLSLTCDIDENLPLTLADPKRLSQIVGNLLHNACKYTPPGGQITLTSTLERSPNGPSSLVIQISDTGPGINPAEQERIFQLFYRSPSQRRIQEGMGIGLALARQLAEAHDGTLTVASPQGTGATFVLRLPVRVPRPAQVQATVSLNPN